MLLRAVFERSPPSLSHTNAFPVLMVLLRAYTDVHLRWQISQVQTSMFECLETKRRWRIHYNCASADEIAIDMAAVNLNEWHE